MTKCLLLLVLIQAVSSTHVLMLYSVLYRSNVQVQRVIADGLLNSGHNVSFVAPISYETWNKFNFDPRVAFIALEHLAESQRVFIKSNKNVQEVPPQLNKDYYGVMSYAAESCKTFFQDPVIVKLLLPADSGYDLVVIDANFNECALALASYMDLGVVQVVTSNRIPLYTKYVLSIPDHPSYSPDQWSSSDTLIFTKRMKALFNYKKMLYLIHYWYYYNINKAITASIPTHKGLVKVIQSTSAILVDTNLAIDLPLPTFPNIIPIGGIQCRPGKVSFLSPEIRAFIDKGKFGTIFVSFGTVFHISDLQYSSLVKLINVFSRAKQQVIWVFDPAYQGVLHLSKNILPVKDIVQQDILAHPKVMLFVTHGGHFSRQEAIYHAVPLIVFPLFDPIQFANAEYIHKKKIGIQFDINAFSEEMLLNGILEVITNPLFENNVQTLSNRMRDYAQPPIDTAVYWINYTAEYKGATHLRSYSMHLMWFQYYLIDVLLFVVVSTCLVLYVIGGIILWCVRRYYANVEAKLQTEKDKNNKGKYMAQSSTFKKEK